jgi:hypothetical protein
LGIDVALVSCLHLPEPDRDETVLSRALREAGLSSRVVAWDDPGVDWTEAALTIPRSCWDYPLRRDAFLGWAGSVSRVSSLWNPLPVIAWNSHKSYLLELDRRGIPVVPTVLVPQGSSRTLREIRAERSWDAGLVVKPAVSAASMGALRVDGPSTDAGEAHLRELSRKGDVLVQRYLPSVEGHGERALVWIDGELTHAVRKGTRFEGQQESVSQGEVAFSGAEADLARRAIGCVQGPLLYGRVDMAPGPGDAPVVMELELIEPSLYFLQSRAALDRFVAAVGHRRRAGGGGPVLSS